MNDKEKRNDFSSGENTSNKNEGAYENFYKSSDQLKEINDRAEEVNGGEKNYYEENPPKMNNSYSDQYRQYQYRQNDYANNYASNYYGNAANENQNYRTENFNDNSQYHEPVQNNYHREKDNRHKPNKGMTNFLLIFLVIAIIVSVFLISSLGGSYIVNKIGNLIPFNNTPSSSSQNLGGLVLETKDHTEQDGALTAQQVYAQCSSSIVGVLTYNSSQGLASTSTAQGSGIIISEDGYIITNSHVTGNSSNYMVTVVTNDQKEYPAKVIGFDTRTDIAVIKIDAKGLKAAQFGNSDQLQVGEWVLAIGNPGGLEFSNSLTRGSVSAVNRVVASANSQVKYIQTDAAINPGNSGGALLNMYGQVIGINSAKITDYEGIGFSIPSNTAKTIVDDIIKKGYVSGRVKMGISVRALSAYEAQANDVPQGLLISEISSDSNATERGLVVGDIITKFDNVSTSTTSALYTELGKHKPGDTVTITVYRLSNVSRTYSSLDLKVTLIEDKGQS